MSPSKASQAQPGPTGSMDGTASEAHCQRVLTAARRHAEKICKYDSMDARQRMTDAFRERNDGKTPHPWQLDTAEAILLGIDGLVIAGTGAGKTVPYMLPVYLSEFKKKVMVIVSPLKALQYDQVRPSLRAEQHRADMIFASAGPPISEGRYTRHGRQWGDLVRTTEKGMPSLLDIDGL